VGESKEDTETQKCGIGRLTETKMNYLTIQIVHNSVSASSEVNHINREIDIPKIDEQ